jgi:hypothetical protein
MLKSRIEYPNRVITSVRLWRLVGFIEILLHNLILSLLENETDKDYLGVRDFRLIHTLLQVIISWGFYPCFLPGVGVPLSKRVKSGYTNHGILCTFKFLE